MLEVLKQRIFKVLKHRDYKPLKLAQLSRVLGVEAADYPEFKRAFDELRGAGQVVIGAGNTIILPAMTNQVIGTFRANPKGFGFVIPLEPNMHGDLFIPPDSTAGAMTGDIVSISVSKKGKRQGQMRYSGRVVKILERANNRFVGTLFKKDQTWYVQPDGTGFTEPITVDDVTAKNAKVKDKVVVEILNYPSKQYLAAGVIIEVLGKAGRYESEIASVIRQFHLPEEFDDVCVDQAHKAASGFNPAVSAEREDIINKIIITIDPPDAKDFDDGISLEKDEQGNWLLGVHIADVSYFVTADSPLDVEARSRGNSIYLPQKTIPMLPETLSNGVCSLQPKQKRFCKSVYITYDTSGKILGRRFANSLMCSAARLTYLQAEGILKGHTKDFKPQVIGLVKNMETLARTIEERRNKSGMLHLAIGEVELVFDKAGRVVDAHKADDSYPHTVIEMFMVEANDAVASLIDQLIIPFMRRIHPEPNELGIKELRRLVKAFGLDLARNPDRFSLQDLLERVKGEDCELAVNLLVLRSLEKAIYSPLDMGHYALASRHYCHFTSPIRRYADLLVHRILDTYLREEQQDLIDKTELAEIGRHISFTEQRAEDAEHELKTVLILQMLKDQPGYEMDTVVTGLAGFGIFVRCVKFGIEGLIPLEELGADEWSFNQRGYYISGVNSGYTIHLGDKIKVRIVSVNISARQLNLTLAEPLVNFKQKVRSQKTKKKFTRKRKGKKGKR